jgi:hypothetical protein
MAGWLGVVGLRGFGLLAFGVVVFCVGWWVFLSRLLGVDVLDVRLWVGWLRFQGRGVLACGVAGTVVCVGLFAPSLVGVSSASVVVAPGWEVAGRFAPSVLAPGSEDALVLYVYNVGGSAEGSASLVDDLPAGLEVAGAAPGGCSGVTEVVCEVGAPKPGGRPVEVRIPVKVVGSPSGEAVNVVTVSGGGALGVTRKTLTARFGSTPAGLGFAGIDGWFTGLDGAEDTQAGSHPFDLTFAFAMNTERLSAGDERPAGGEPRDLQVNLPAGLVGNPNAVPQCTRAEFDQEVGFTAGEEGEGCPADTQIGTDTVELSNLGPALLPVHNLVPPPGVAAQFGVAIDGIDVFLDARVRSGGDNGITESIDNLPQRGIEFNSTTIWGVPAEKTHDSERDGVGCIEDGMGECGSNAPVRPFLTLPTSCGAPQEVTSEVDGIWQQELGGDALDAFATHNDAGEPVGFTGCERLVHFDPSVAIAPDTTYADTPAGLSVDLRMPQEVNPEGLATSGLEGAKVTLPEGLVINPGQAAGLASCSPAEQDLGGESEVFDGPPSCPAASKVGTDEVSTPLLPDKLQGDIYVLPSNPPHLQLLVTASGDGVNLKMVGNVELDPLTGRLTTTFTSVPDAPFTEFQLNFSGGAQAALSTPTACGSYTSEDDFTPWASVPDTGAVADALVPSTFAIDSGPNGSACASPLPFSASLSAGATTDQADGYTDFTMLLSRGDGQQRISSLQFKMPEGLLAMISSVPLCGEPQAAAGTCPEASDIGHTVVTAGAGPYPLVVPQPGEPAARIALTGPYDGAPYGLSISVPVIAGPFNLGTEVVRARIEVDRRTSQVTITTGTLPSILDGIPTDLRSIYAVIDRPGFTFNPSNCNPMAFTGTAYSTQGATAALSSPFQVGSCQSLKFKPDFKVSTTGKTSKTLGASLAVKIEYPTGNPGSNQASSQANLARVKVELPKRLPSQLKTLQKACRAAVFAANPANCPEQSVVGHATVHTPLLSGALVGPAYFVSHGGEAFPSLILVLQGQGIVVELEGTTFISKQGITTSTFKSTPDVPFTSFELVLPQGPYSALAANGDLCNGKLEMPTEFVGQNGAVINQSTKIAVTNCPKKKTSKGKKAAKKSKQASKKH